MRARMFLQAGGRYLELPVLPEKLAVEAAGDNQADTVLGLGEINRLEAVKLRQVEWESLFPLHPAPYVTGPLTPPMQALALIQSWREQQLPVDLLLCGMEGEASLRMAIEDFSYEERGGEPGDKYYKISLKEYRDYSPRRIQIDPDGAARLLAPLRPEGSGAQKGRRHIVAPGESLWSLARRYYGSEERVEMLYQTNRGVLEAANLAAGAPRYTIRPGQELVIP